MASNIMRPMQDPFGMGVDLHDLCNLIYQGTGQHTVLKFVRLLQQEQYISADWKVCEPCDIKSAFMDGACLICGNEDKEAE